MTARRLIKGDPAGILARFETEADCLAERVTSAVAHNAFAAFMQKQDLSDRTGATGAKEI